MRAAVLLACALAAPPAFALEEVAWPPTGEAAARMHELQQVIISRDATPAQRNAARAELGRMLMANERPLPDDKGRKPRAAIDPYPGIVKPVNIAPAPASVPPSSVAHVEVVEPARPVVNPRSGSPAVPLSAPPSFAPAPPPFAPAPPAFATDPRTGATLHPSGNGYVDPRTGQFIPR